MDIYWCLEYKILCHLIEQPIYKPCKEAITLSYLQFFGTIQSVRGE